MYRYEILILTIPEITKDEASTLEFQIDKLIKKIKGSIISFERWGKYRLAYPVRKNDYGVYFLVRFEVEDKQSIVKDLNTLFAVKFSDIVMRKLISKLDANQSLEYQKPPSLEDTPKRHISSFLEEKGLLRGNRKKTDVDQNSQDEAAQEEKVVVDEVVVEKESESADQEGEPVIEEASVKVVEVEEPEESGSETEKEV